MAILDEKDPLYKELMSTEGQAEIINGEIVKFARAGFLVARDGRSDFLFGGIRKTRRQRRSLWQHRRFFVRFATS